MTRTVYVFFEIRIQKHEMSILVNTTTYVKYFVSLKKNVDTKYNLILRIHY